MSSFLITSKTETIYERRINMFSETESAKFTILHINQFAKRRSIPIWELQSIIKPSISPTSQLVVITQPGHVYSERNVPTLNASAAGKCATLKATLCCQIYIRAFASQPSPRGWNQNKLVTESAYRILWKCSY